MPARVAGREMSSPVVIHHQIDQHKHNLRNRFELLKTLGQGTYGKVKLAIDRITGDEVAIKYIKKTKVKSEQDLVRIRREIDIMANLSHPHITTIYEVFENKEKIILVMEYASGGELYDYINEKQGLDEEEARKFFRQIVSAVQYLHKNGIVHRDLKLENIVMDHMGDIKIADFGLANVYSDDSMLQTFCGSPLYASPEIVNGLPYYGPEVDCWSLGVLLYTIVYGAMPFDGSDFRKLRNQITTGKYYEPENASECAGLIRSILTVNPEKRADIKDIGNHWWVNLGYKYTPMADVRTLLCEETNFRDQENSLTLSSSTDSDSDCELSPTHQNDPVQSVPRKGILKKPKVESLDAVFSGAEDHEEKVDLKQMQKEHCEQELDNDSLDELDTAEERRTSLRQSNENINDTNQNVHSGEGVRVVPESVFDCNKKPKRGILKNKHKYTGSDSGCIIVDLPSKGRASSTSSDLPLQESHSPEGHDDTYDLTDIEAVLNEVETAETSSEAIMKHPSVGKYAQNYDYDDSETSPTNTHFSPDINIEENNIVRRRKGILKKHSKYSSDYDPTNRYSYGSTGSNSSGDILDFSYDSLDEESYMQKHCVPLSLQIHQDLPQKQSICDEDYTKNCCNGFEEAETNFGADFDSDSLEQNSPEQDIFQKIQSLDGAICGIQKNSSDSDLFDLKEAQLVYSQALQICKDTQ